MSEFATPSPGAGQLSLHVHACGVCRTDLHVVDGELPHPHLPVTPGHEIVGQVTAVGQGVAGFKCGDRIGVPWLGWTCGVCAFCRRGEENLCPSARFTGYQIDGGFATDAVVDARFAFSIPERYSNLAAAPLLCAGLIGWRALKAAGKVERLGLYGFGAAAHIAVQIANMRQQEVFAFVRPGDESAKRFARTMGAHWVGDSGENPPVVLDGAIMFAPVGDLIPAALRAVRPGGTVVCGGIYMTDIPSFPYELLWGERTLCSVANLTRADANEFLKFAAERDIQTVTSPYSLDEANAALADLRNGRLTGAAVLVP